MTTNAESQKNTSVNDANRGRRWYSVFHSQSGQSLVELALITPLLLVVILGIIEMGRYAYLSILVGNAAETGAEFAAQNLNNAGQISGTTPYVQDAALLDFQNGTSLSGLVVTPTYACYCDSGTGVYHTGRLLRGKRANVPFGSSLVCGGAGHRERKIQFFV